MKVTKKIIPHPQEMDRLVEQAIARSRAVVKNKLNECYDWLVDYIPKPINQFVSNAHFIYPLKTSDNLTVFWCFKGVEKGCIGKEWIRNAINKTFSKVNNIILNLCNGAKKTFKDIAEEEVEKKN